MLEESDWDRFKKEQEDKQNTVKFHEFEIFQYFVMDGSNKGELAFEVYQIDGLWIWESKYDQKGFDDIDDFIDFMKNFNIISI